MLDLDTVWRRGTPQSLIYSAALLLFGFSNHSLFAFTSVSSGEQPPRPPSSDQHGCFLEQNRVLLKCVLIHNMDAEDRLRCIFKAQLHVQKADQWKRFLPFSLSARGNKTSIDAASSCDHEMTSRLCSGPGDGFSILLTNTCLLPADNKLSAAQSSSLFLDTAFRVRLVLAKILIKSAWILI